MVGDCVPDSICNDLSAVGLQCYWFDASEYAGSPPPAATCRATPDSSPLCGGACGDCTPVNFMLRYHCLGRNGEREPDCCHRYGRVRDASEAEAEGAQSCEGPRADLVAAAVHERLDETLGLVLVLTGHHGKQDLHRRIVQGGY